MTSRQYVLDKAGMWTSAICAVHCIVLPVVISLSAFSSWTFLHNEGVENVAWTISALIAVFSLGPSYINHHRKVASIIIFLLGFMLIGLSRFMVNVNEAVLASTGAALVAVAHFINFKLCKKYHKVTQA